MGPEEKRTDDTPRVGVYICHCGGNISDHVDVETVAEQARSLPGVAVARTNVFMCSDPGQDLIRKDIEEGLVNRVVVASCAPSLHETTFRGAIRRADLSPYLYEHANIREQVSWVHHGPRATGKAACLVAAAAAKARLLDPLSPIRVQATPHAVVIGGGVAGMRAALSLADRGIAVLLLEKSPFLGGRVSRLNRLAPTGRPAAEVVGEMAELVSKRPGITVLTCSTVTDFSGYVGNFSLSVSCRPEEAPRVAPGTFVPDSGVFVAPPEACETKTVKTGALVLATGNSLYTPRTGEYGFGELPQVVTLEKLQAVLREAGEGGRLRVNGRPISRAAMIHCVGSRGIPGVHEPGPDGVLHEHCSRTCCTATLSAANEIRDRFPETAVFDFYRDIRTYGRGHEDIYERAGKNGVTFFRFEPESPPEVGPGSGGHPVSIRVKDSLTFGEEVELGVDLVVLATGMAAGDIAGLTEMMKLPVGADGFLLEVHPKLRPVEVANTGIYLAGTCQAPMDVSEACAAAQAATAKASILLSRGFVELDPFVAQVDESLCNGCGECVSACPVQDALHLKQAKGGEPKALVNAALCNGCGVCVAACEQRAIDVMGFRLSQYEAMVDAIAAQP